MPFNAELEDFAKSFSTGYGMVRSREEEEYEKLGVELRRGEVEDLAAERERRPEKWRQEDVTFASQQAESAAALKELQVRTGLSEQELILAQEGNSEESRTLRKRTAEAQAAAAEAEAKRNAWLADDKNLALETAAKEAEIKAREAQLRASDAAARASDAATRGEDLKSRVTELELGPLERINKIIQQQTGAGSLAGGDRFAPPAGAPAEAVPAGEVPPGTGFGRIGGAPAAPALTAPGPETPGETTGTHDGGEEAMPTGGERVKDDEVDEPLVHNKGTPGSRTEAAVEKIKRGEPITRDDLIDASIVATNEGHRAAKKNTGAGNMDEEAVPTPETDLNYANWLNGSYGADDDTAQMVMDTMQEITQGNPDDSLASAMGAGWLMYSAMGQPEKALGFAQGMAGYADRLSGMYAAFGQAAAENGDISATNQALMKAYMHVNNGQILSIRPDPRNEGKFIARIMDLKSNKIIDEKVVTPEETMAFAMGVTPGTGIDLVDKAAGREDKTISNSAAEVIAREYKEFDITAEEISAMTTAEFAQVRAGWDAIRKERKPEEYTDAELASADTAVRDAFSTFTASPEAADQANTAMLMLNDPGVQEDIVPGIKEIYLRNKGKGKIDAQRALRAALNIMTDGPEEVFDIGNDNGDLVIRTKKTPKFIMSADNYHLMVAHRWEAARRLKLEQGPPAPGSEAEAEKPKGDTKPRPAPTPREAPSQPRGAGVTRPMPPQRSGGSIFDNLNFEPTTPMQQPRGAGSGVGGGLQMNINPNPSPRPTPAPAPLQAVPAGPVARPGAPYIIPNSEDYPEELIRRGYAPGR